jgi:hypothetical protein
MHVWHERRGGALVAAKGLRVEDERAGDQAAARAGHDGRRERRLAGESGAG